MFERLVLTKVEPNQDGWMTHDEKRFIDGLGSHAPRLLESRGLRTALEVTQYRLKLLQSYESVLDFRLRWGKIDEPAIREHVAATIEKTKTELSAIPISS